MTATVDLDQLAALRVLRYWLGDVQVLGVVERGSGGSRPRDTGRQLALSIEAQVPRVDPAVKGARRAAP
jgi:hypothetical protein